MSFYLVGYPCVGEPRYGTAATTVTVNFLPLCSSACHDQCHGVASGGIVSLGRESTVEWLVVQHFREAVTAEQIRSP